MPGPITEQLAEYAKKYRMVMIVPVYEKAMDGVYYNTAAVIDADGAYLGKFRKIHIPHTWPGFWEKFYFKPGNLGFPVFETAYAKIGIFICYDRHFPECARILALNGAEILFNPSATTSGKSQYLWELEQPAQAVANGVFIGANNRVGLEKPWDFGRFYGSSYFVDPRGEIVAKGSETRTRSSSPTSTWSRSGKSGTAGSFSAIGARRCIRRFAGSCHKEMVDWRWYWSTG